MLTRRTLYAYKLAIGLLVAWTLGSVAVASFVFPGALTASDEDRPPRTIVMRSTTPDSPHWADASGATAR